MFASLWHVNNMLQSLLAIVAGLLYAARRYYKKKEADRAQDEADRVSDKPVDWFRDHFRVQSDTADGSETEASDTDAPKRK